MLAQSTDSGQLIAAAVIKLFHAMKVEVQDLRGVGIQVQLLEGHQSATQDCRGLRGRSIKEMLLGQASSARSTNRGAFGVFLVRLVFIAVCKNHLRLVILLQMLQTRFRRRLLPLQQSQQQTPRHILCHLLSQYPEQARNNQRADKLQSILGHVSTSVSKSPPLHRSGLE